jgi:hypothetical protein
MFLSKKSNQYEMILVWNSPILMSSGQPCSVSVPISIFHKPHLTETSKGTFLQLLPLTGLADIATGQAGAA